MKVKPTPAVQSGNHEVAVGLRELAAFLDAHPELPHARYAAVSLRHGSEDCRGRETLEQLAGVLGDRAVERELYGRVEIVGEFGPVTLRAAADIAELADVAPVAYKPILAAA